MQTNPEVNTPAGPAVSTGFGIILLDDLFHHNSADGVLWWKPRPRQWFGINSSFASWNAKYPGKVALASMTPKGYMIGAIFRRNIFMHRVLYAIHHGRWPAGVIDHINGVKDDNRAINLRDVPQSENGKNRAKMNTSKAKVVGVKPVKKKWVAYIGSRPTICIGSFDRFEDACAARKAAEVEHGFHENHGR